VTSARLRSAVTALGGVAVLALPLVVVPHATHTGWATIREQLAAVSVTQLTVLAAVWLAGLYVHSFVATGALTGLTHRRAMALNFSGSTVSHLTPFGGVLGIAVNFSMVRSWGYDSGHFAVLTLLTNLFNAVMKLLLPTIALALLVAFSHSSPTLWTTALVSLAALGAVLATATITFRSTFTDTAAGVPRPLAAIVHRFVGRAAHEMIATVRTNARTVIETSWRRMSIGMLGYVLLQATLLGLCLTTTKATVAPLAVFAAYAIGSALTLVPITPGGVGFAEAGMAAILVGFGAAPAAVAAAVLLYSTFTRWMEIPFGAATTAWWYVRRSTLRVRRNRAVRGAL
jgi:uncharacterized protein (TIRG00374 family)